MAIWEALVDGEKRRLDDDGTLYLLQVFGVGLPPARRLKTRSPQQHGATDLGFRYDEREMRLGFFFNAGNPASAVAKRDEIYSFWRSLESTPIQLRYTRDDNTVRQIDCYVTGVLDMPWNPNENQMGNQDFVVQVEAADPLWYDPVQDSTSFSQADNLDWWLALGTVTGSNVAEHVEEPAQDQSFDNGILIANGSPWAIYFHTEIDSFPVGTEVPYRSVSTSGGVTSFMTSGSLNSSSSNSIYSLEGGFAEAMHGVFVTGNRHYAIVSNGVTTRVFRDGVEFGSVLYAYGIDGSKANSTWRGWGGGINLWTPEISHGAIFDIALNANQLASLISAVDGIEAGSIGASKTITYNGSFLAYPIVTIIGPITDPVLTNVSTGEDLDFTGITIAGGDSYTIDCRFGYKTVRNAAGANKRADLTAASDLETFHLGADPEVGGGVNAFTLTGTGTDSNTLVTVAYRERFVGA